MPDSKQHSPKASPWIGRPAVFNWPLLRHERRRKTEDATWSSLDLRQLTCIFDYFVIATGTSRRQLHAMSEEIDHKLEDDLGDQRMGIEGYAESRWILLDYGTVVIHLFDEETRKYFALEELWAEAPKIEWQAPARRPARAASALSLRVGRCWLRRWRGAASALGNRQSSSSSDFWL